MLNRDTTSWIVASTHPQQEALAISNLARQGFESYCPRVRKRVRHARQVREILSPLFPGYVFIRLDPKLQQWRSIDSTFGVRNLIRFGEVPGTIPNEFVAMLHASEDAGVVALPRARDSYLPGEKVRMRDGPFDGLIATVLAVSDGERVTVLMDLLKRSVHVRVSINEIVPEKPTPAMPSRGKASTGA